MWNRAGAPQFGPVSAHQLYTLANDISAMQILPFEEAGKIRLGPVSKLPRGAKIETCGGGFNAATLKVEYGGQFFYVFSQDLVLTGPNLLTATA